MSKVVDLKGEDVAATEIPVVENDFHIVLNDGGTIVAKGFIHVTPSFIAVVNKDDVMQVCVPSDKYQFVQNIGPSKD